MTPKASDKRPSGRSWWVHVTVLAILAGALGLYFTRARQKSPLRGHASGEVARSSYRNRAVARPREAPADDAPALPAIRGTVYDMDGFTVAGATLVAMTYDIAGNVATRVAGTTSDDRGAFEIPLRQGTYQVNASKEGYGPSTVVVQTGDTASVVLPKSGRVKGRVVDEKGRAVTRFTIDIVSAVPGDVPAPPPIWSRKLEDEDGAFEVAELPAWPFIVRASTPDLAPAFSQPLSVRVGETRDVQITLTEGCLLQGKVVDKGGLAQPRVLVNVEQRLMAAATADPAIQASAQAVTDEDGTFRLDHVPRGSAMLRGYDGDNAPSTLVIEIKDCEKLAPVMLVMSPGGSVEGTARRADGTPIAGARVSATDRSLGVVNTTSDAEGRYRFDELPPALVRVSMEHEGQSVLSFVQVRENVTSEVDLTLFEEGTGKLEGRVMAGKRPIAGARLLIASNHGREKGIAMYFPVTGEDGTFTVPSLPAGAYLLNVMSTSAGTGVRVVKDETAKAEIDLAAVAAARAPTDGARERPQRRARRGVPPPPPPTEATEPPPPTDDEGATPPP